MQVSIILFIWLYIRSLKTWLSGLVFLVLLPSGRETARARSERLQTWLDNTQQLAAVVSGLVEFQKAQSYFAMTMQGAALLALDGRGQLLDAGTGSQVGMTVFLIATVATTSIVCITFGLYMLHAARKTSWYTSAVSALAALLCLITWSRTRLGLGNIVPDAQSASPIPSCGGQNPASFCAPIFGIWTPLTTMEIPVISVCSTILLVLLLAQSGNSFSSLLAKVWTLPTNAGSPPMQKLERQLPTASSRLKRGVLVLWYRSGSVRPHVRHGFIEAAFVFLACVMLWIMITTTSKIALKNGQWTFGQLIAVTIWAPSIIEWVYAATGRSKADVLKSNERGTDCFPGGVEEAHSHRFTKSFKVIRQDTDTTRSDDDEGDQEMTLRPREQTFYRRLNSRSELELPLVHTISSARSSFQEARDVRHVSV